MRLKQLKVPSAQHCARNYNDDPQRIAKDLVALVKGGPTFSYSPIYSAIVDMLVLDVPFEDVKRGIDEKIKREGLRSNFLSILELAHDYFQNEKPDFVNRVSERRYPLARSPNGELLSIPFTPPMVYGVGGRLIFPWFIFWRSNPLRNEKLILFASIVKEILSQDPDLEDAEFEIHDYSAPDSKSQRRIQIIKAADLPNLSKLKRDEMLSNFAKGYFLAQQQLSSQRMHDADASQENRAEEVDPRQGDFFS